MSEYRFDLEPDEREAVREFHAEFDGPSDDQLQRALADAPRRQGGA